MPVSRPQQLGEQRLGVASHREQVAVAAVRARDTVAVAQHAREADSDRFLPGVEVRRPVDLAAQEQALHAVLEPADQQHLAVEAEREFGRGRRCLHQPFVVDWPKVCVFGRRDPLTLQRHMQSQPPSTARLIPLTAPFSSKKRDASTTSAIVTSRPVGVR